MSGGAFDYLFYRLEEVAYELYPLDGYSKAEKILAQLLMDLSKVMKAVEWYRSGDTGFEDFKQEFLKFAQKWLKEGFVEEIKNSKEGELK